MAERTPLLLRGAVQHYAWGGYDLIPGLLGVDNRERKPHAELWFGAHPSAPALVETAGGPVRLDELIAAAPAELLGPAVARLPYLLKILDVRQMLSIQAHPSRRQAEEGFERECRAGVHFNYTDANHKPEVQVALTEFRLLHGFRREPVEGTPPAEMYARIMRMPEREVKARLDPLVARLEREQPRDKDTHDYWAWRASREFPGDRGILCLYLLNLVRLAPGQGTYQAPGVLHAYLEGATVELMANSDNVLRGGLTSKRVDVEELLRVLSPESGAPEILDGARVSPCEVAYRTPAEEFELSRIEVAGTYAGVAARGPEILVMLGSRPAEARFVPYGARYELAGPGVVFRAAMP